ARTSQFSEDSSLTGSATPHGQFILSGPSERLDAAHWPVRGDLAHIALAGRYFVPHYAVPQPRFVLGETAVLLAAPREDAEQRGTLARGARFDVLDIAGEWAWGCAGEGGAVGYVRLASLGEPPAGEMAA